MIGYVNDICGGGGHIGDKFLGIPEIKVDAANVGILLGEVRKALPQLHFRIRALLRGIFQMSTKIRQLVAGEDIGCYGADVVEVLVQQRLHLCQQHLVVVQRLPGVFIAAEKVDGNPNDDRDQGQAHTGYNPPALNHADAASPPKDKLFHRTLQLQIMNCTEKNGRVSLRF